MKQTQTDWEAAYRRGETPWEKGAAHPALVEFLRARGPFTGEILVPGCGSGHDVRALSAPENRVLGIDLAPSAIRRAQAHTLVARESYLLADLFALPGKMAGRFDLVFEHTCFCAINPARRKEYVETVANLLKPNGALLAIFFLDPDHDQAGPPFRVRCARAQCAGEPCGRHRSRALRDPPGAGSCARRA